jgi:hypothetical protein
MSLFWELKIINRKESRRRTLWKLNKKNTGVQEFRSSGEFELWTN